MIKKTLYFGNPTYLSLRLDQLVIQLPEVQKKDTVTLEFKKVNERTIPIEDIGIVILDNQRITITSGVIEALLKNNCAVITCDNHRMPHGLLLPLEGNTLQHERFLSQIESSLPLRKQLWAQTVRQKILNQKSVLESFNSSVETNNMTVWANKVRSGDPDNMEARSAAYYWKSLFPLIPNFTRDRYGIPPNNLLNYGYAILRAVVARSLVANGLLPTLGIHHSNRYNAYCLADDIMEPYRPYIDKLVIEIMGKFDEIDEITRDLKAELLQIPVLDVIVNGKRSPLMVALGMTTASLARCFAGESHTIAYPVM